MIRTVYFACHLPKATAAALNAESGRIYSQVLVEHWRIYRHQGIWLSPKADERLNDFYNAEQPKLLHAHSIDAAQQGFAKAVKTTHAARKAGFTDAHFPHKRKRYRTTVWKNSALKLRQAHLLLALARGQEALTVELPPPLRTLPIEAFQEMRLVYNASSRRYEWHLVVEDGVEPKGVESGVIAAGDLGEIHPITLTDGKVAAVIACRELRATNQYSNKRLAGLKAKQASKVKGSKRWWRVQKRINRFLAKQERRKRDLNHKVSHEAVAWCVENGVQTLAVGDVRDIANGKRLNSISQQKISNWSHGKLRNYLNYKAEAKGITVNDKVDEAYTTQTCVSCGNRQKPKGRVYTCSACGAVVHRDVQGAANILSRFVYGELAKVPAVVPKYRHPVLQGKRSPPGTGQVARERSREAAPL
jgi:putative transposase